MWRRPPIASRRARRRPPVSPRPSKASSRRVTPSEGASRFLRTAAVAALLHAAGVRAFAMQATAERHVVGGGGCELSPGAYESQGYTVRRVEVRGTFDLFQLAPSTAARAIGIDFPVEGEP